MENPTYHPFSIEYSAEFKQWHLFGPGEQWIFAFPNGHGASVVRNTMSYGNKNGEGFWELAVLDRSGELDYTTIITDDVIGWLTEDEVSKILDAISRLPIVLEL